MRVTQQVFTRKTPLSLDNEPSLEGSRHPLDIEDQEASQEANGRALRSPLLAFTVYVTSNVFLYTLQLISLKPGIMGGKRTLYKPPLPTGKGVRSFSKQFAVTHTHIPLDRVKLPGALRRRALITSE